MKKVSLCAGALALLLLILVETNLIKLEFNLVKSSGSGSATFSNFGIHPTAVEYDDDTGKPERPLRKDQTYFAQESFVPSQPYVAVVHYRLQTKFTWTHWLPLFKDGANQASLVYDIYRGPDGTRIANGTIDNETSLLVLGFISPQAYEHKITDPLVKEMKDNVSKNAKITPAVAENGLKH